MARNRDYRKIVQGIGHGLPLIGGSRLALNLFGKEDSKPS